MGKWTDTLAAISGSGIPGAILGIGMAGWNDERQIRQEEKLQRLQIAGSKELTDYQMQKQLEMWKATSYKAQMEQMIKAGINPALMYGMGGGGGQTTGGSASQVSRSNAPTGGGEVTAMAGMGIQFGMMEAQRRNIEADTKLKEAEAAKTAGVDTTLAQTQTMDLLQGIQNKQAQEVLTRVQTRLAELEEQFKGRTLENNIERVGWELSRATEEVDHLARENRINKATENDKIDQIKANLAATLLENEIRRVTPANIEADTKLKKEQLWQLSRAAVQRWREIEIQGTKAGSDAMVDIARQIHEETKLPMDIVDQIMNGVILKSILTPPKPGTTPVRGFHDR